MVQGRVFAALSVLAAGAAIAVAPTAGASTQGRAGGAAPTASVPCPPAPPGFATCLARVFMGSGPASGSSGSARSADAAAPEAPAPGPSGLSPAALATAYDFSGTNGGAGETIAIVDAYDDPTIAANLSSFSSQFGLPACTTTNGCFTKVNQTGGTTYPSVTSGWGLEISLDVEWAHALAPSAHVMLVEANTSSEANLFTAVTYAAKHAQYVSMSWGGTEISGETTFDGDFALTPGVSFFAASGDSASSVIYPSTSPDVVSVGGTTLNVTAATSAWKSETAWSTAGGGCSQVEKATAAQKAFPTYDQAGATCAGKRATPDVALDANPSTGVSVYDSRKLSTGLSGWITVGGTSASTVMWAAHSASTGSHVNATYVYGANIPFYNVTSGSNGHPCEKGYSLCTGLGSWNTAEGSINGAPVGNLSFSTAPQTLTAGKPSAAVTVHLSSPAPAGGVSVKLSTTSSAGTFSSAPTGAFTRTLTVPVAAGSTGATAYYEDTVAGSPTLSATASGWTTATQNETVQPGTLAKITVSPSTVTLAAGATQVFTASGYDSYGNAVTNGFDPTWSTTTGGSLSTTSGATTKLTAPSTAVSKGSVSATQGAVSGSATVTVQVTPTVKVSITAGTTSRAGTRYKVPLTVKATGTSNTGIDGATVQLSVYGASCSGSPLASGSGRTGSAGTVVISYTTTAIGSYCAKATVTATGYSQGSATVQFAVAAVKVGVRSARTGSGGSLLART